MLTPLSVTFPAAQSRIPVPFTFIDDEIEEGYENFTLLLSYDEQDDEGTIQIVNTSTMVWIKDNDGWFSA